MTSNKEIISLQISQMDRRIITDMVKICKQNVQSGLVEFTTFTAEFQKP